jgi:hypothetical protein
MPHRSPGPWLTRIVSVPDAEHTLLDPVQHLATERRLQPVRHVDATVGMGVGRRAQALRKWMVDV